MFAHLKILKNILNVHSCLSITWDKDWCVYGAVFNTSGKKLIIGAYTSCKDKALTFPEKLKTVYSELKGDEKDRVLVGGYLHDALILSLNTPSLKLSEVNKFLSYELPRHLPYSTENLIWTFRPVSFTPSLKTKTEQIKIMFMSRTFFQKLTEDLIASKIKFDAILHPYLVTEPLYTGTKLVMDNLNNLFFSDSDELQGWHMSPLPTEKESLDRLIEEREFVFHIYQEYIKEDFNSYIPCIVLAEYGLSLNFSVDRKLGLEIPLECKPKRLRGLKVITLFLVAVFFVVFGYQTVRESINCYNVLSELKIQKAKLVAESAVLKKKTIAGKKIDTIIQQIVGSIPDDIEILDFIEYLNKTVPAGIWLNYLNTYGNSANLTFQTGSSSDKMISDFYKSEHYTLQNSRKNKSGDGIEYIYANFVKKDKTTKPTSM